MRLTSVALATCVGTSLVFAQGEPTASGTELDEGQGAVIEIPGMRKLTISGQYRLRYENHYNSNFNDDVSTNDDFFTQRFRLNFDMEFNDDMSAFVMFQDVRNWGEETGGTVARLSPGLDIHQGYLNAKNVIGGELRIGRQILAYGDERLIGGLEWLSQGRAFDGFRHRWSEDDSHKIDLFATQIQEDLSVKNEYTDAYFLGAYGTLDFGESEGDLYVLFRHDNDTGNFGRENRLTAGLRFDGDFDAVELEAEVASQYGEKDGADIPFGETFAAHLHGQVNLGEEQNFFIRLDGDAASGDDPNTPENERFDVLYPTAHKHLGMMDFVLWENIVHASAALGFKPTPKSKLALAWHYFQAFEATDAVFGPSGALSNGGPGIDKELGNEIDLFYNVDLGTERVKTSIQVGYGILLPGQGVEDSLGGDDPAHFVYAQGFAQF